MSEKSTTPEAGILPKKFPELHTSSEVSLVANTKDQPEKKIGAYLASLEGRHGFLGGSDERRAKQIAHEVIDPEAIPEAYFELQQRIAREQGHGDVEISQDMRDELAEAIIADQTASLEDWIDYINHPDADYPTWFRYFTVRSVLKMADFDKKKNEFRKRSKSTTAQYPDLNREALAYVYDSLTGGDEDQPKDEDLQKMIKGQNFAKLYAHAILEVTPASQEQRLATKGAWKKFDKTDDKNQAKLLAKTLQGHGTGWCTAGESTAARQLSGGDFYVYYSEDEDGNETIPRIAIRMQQGMVVEVRGINPEQELEPIMLETAQQKLQELPGGQEYSTKFEHMKKLTTIDKKLKDNAEALLSKDELRFLYEIDEPIQGFGYKKDPRVEEILGGRNAKQDIAYVIDVTPEQISTTTDEALSGGILFHYGSLRLYHLTSADGLELPEVISGSLDLKELTSTKGLRLPRIVGESLFLTGLTSAEGLKLPESIGERLVLNGLTSAEGLELPETMSGSLILNSLTSAEGLELPELIEGHLYLKKLASAEGLKLPESIGGDIILGSIISTEGLKLPESINGDLSLDSLTSAEGLELPESIGGSLGLYSLTSAEGLELPKSIGKHLDLSSLTSAEGLKLPESIGGSLRLSKLISAEGLELPKSIGRSLSLPSLTSAEGLKLPESIGGSLRIDKLDRVEKNHIKKTRPDLQVQ